MLFCANFGTFCATCYFDIRSHCRNSKNQFLSKKTFGASFGQFLGKFSATCFFNVRSHCRLRPKLLKHQLAEFLHIELMAVWPVKNCQMSIKVAQNDFTRKWMILTPLQKLPKNVGEWGKIIDATGFKCLPKKQKNRPIWSHWLTDKRWTSDACSSAADPSTSNDRRLIESFVEEAEGRFWYQTLGYGDYLQVHGFARSTMGTVL